MNAVVFLEHCKELAAAEPSQGPAQIMTLAEIEGFLAEIRLGDQLLDQLLSADGVHS